MPAAILPRIPFHLPVLPAGRRPALRRATIFAGLALFVLNTANCLCANAGMLTAPTRLFAGGTSAATVTAFDSVTRDPNWLVTFDLDLVSSDKSRRWSLGSGVTDLGGQGRVEFAVPSVPPGSYKLEARLRSLSEPISVSTTVTDVPAILIETDKPIYKPSQTIQGRIVLLDNALRPRAGQVEVTFHDAKGIRIARQKISADQFGAGKFSLPLAHELNAGTWKIRASGQGAETIRDVRVQNYTLPRYDLKVEFAKSWALVDEPVRGTVSARYFFGKQVNGKVTLVAKRWVGTWSEYARAEGTFSEGSWKFEIPPVRFISGTLDAGGKGTITIDISATDSTGHTQTMTEVLTITDAAAILKIIPRSKSLKERIQAEIAITSEVPDGTPLSLQVETRTRFVSLNSASLGELASTVSTVNGLGVLRITPPSGTAYAEITASAQVQGRKTAVTARLGSSYTPSGSVISVVRTDGTGVLAAGQVATFSVLSTDPGTVYYEVYAGGRTILSSATESNVFSVVITRDMMPRSKIVVYKITPYSEVAADSLSFDVALNVSVSVGANFSAGRVKPGESVQLTIDAGTGRRTLLGASIVDNSVLALGRSRLHLQQVFEDLERRFLEPQAEVHEDGSPIGPMPAFRVQTRGALDILKEAGLAVAVSGNVILPQGRSFRGFDPDIVISAPPAGGGAGAAPEPPRLRQFFPETWVWEPLLLTDESGKATLKLQAPDSITSWKLSVVGTCPDASAKSGIGFGEAELTVFQDFFVEPSLPSSAVRGERFSVKVDIFNYLDQEQNVVLTLDKSRNFELEGSGQISVKVPPGSTASANFPIRPTQLGELPVRITAIGSSHADAVLRQLTIIAEGTPVEQVVNSVVRAGDALDLAPVIPLGAIQGSARTFLHLTPNLVAQSMKGVSELLHMPFGCGEQNMIFLAPDFEILKYLREIGELAPEIRAKAESFINVGYQRQLTFQTADGGFAAFGGANGSLWLTAFVLSTFSGGRELRDIDETVLTRAARMMVLRQNDDGSFRTDSFLIHTEMDGGIDNIYALTAYVANALADYGGTEIKPALAKAASYLENARISKPTINDSAYALAIAAVALQKIPGFEPAAERIIDRLLQLAISKGIGLHWEPYPVETTGYAAMALMTANAGQGRPEASSALEWLSTQRNALGGYGRSTQDTVVALRALFLAARKTHSDINVQLTVIGAGRVLSNLNVDASNFDLFHQVELPADGGPFSLRASGKGSVAYQLVTRFNVPGDFLPPPRDLLLDVTYNTSHIESDNLVDISVKVTYTGQKSRTGMVIVDVGVPTGFEVVQASLDALISQKVVQRVEVAGRKIIFYIDSLTRSKQLAFGFQIKALYPVRAEGVVSKAYEYYDASVQAHQRQPAVSFGRMPARSRTRP